MALDGIDRLPLYGTEYATLGQTQYVKINFSSEQSVYILTHIKSLTCVRSVWVCVCSLALVYVTRNKRITDRK